VYHGGVTGKYGINVVGIDAKYLYETCPDSYKCPFYLFYDNDPVWM